MNKCHNLTHLDEKWPLALGFDQKVKVWLFSVQSNFDQLTKKFICQSLCIWDLLSLLNNSIWCHWVLESMVEPNFPLARSNSQKLPLYSQNPKNDHFALLVIWSNFLWSCGPNLIKWFIWVYNVYVGQNSWGLIVNWPQLTFSPIQLIYMSIVQLTGQKFDSRLETW